jgi:hypothetical protein
MVGRERTPEFPKKSYQTPKARPTTTVTVKNLNTMMPVVMIRQGKDKKELVGPKKVIPVKEISSNFRFLKRSSTDFIQLAEARNQRVEPEKDSKFCEVSESILTQLVLNVQEGTPAVMPDVVTSEVHE